MCRPCRRFADPVTYARAMAATGPAFEAMQNVGELQFLAAVGEAETPVWSATTRRARPGRAPGPQGRVGRPCHASTGVVAVAGALVTERGARGTRNACGPGAPERACHTASATPRTPGHVDLRLGRRGTPATRRSECLPTPTSAPSCRGLRQRESVQSGRALVGRLVGGDVGHAVRHGWRPSVPAAGVSLAHCGAEEASRRSVFCGRGGIRGRPCR
jgi:hypothetical protein